MLYVENLIINWPWASFVVLLFVLIKSTDIFIEGSENIGFYFGMSSFLTSITIVSLGSSLPELTTSVIATLDGQSNFVVDDVVGANITNILLIGSMILLYKPHIKIEIKKFNLFFLVAITIIFLLIIFDKEVNVIEGMILLLLLVIFLVRLILNRNSKKITQVKKIDKQSMSKNVLRIIVGSFFVIESSKYIIMLVEYIAVQLNVSIDIITIIAVTFGTSISEIIISWTFIKKGKILMAIGNVIGSSTFNILMVVGMSSMIDTLTVSKKVLDEISFLIIATFSFVFAIIWLKNSKYIGYSFLLLYVIFCYHVTNVFD